MIRGKISGCDPCKSDWKARINELWAKYQNVVKTVIMGGKAYHPDGDGTVTLPLPAPSLGVALYDLTTYWSLLTVNDDIVILTNHSTYWTMETVTE